MPTRPPRREPRVLAVCRARGGLQYAVADPWELRSAGSFPATTRAEALHLRRLVRREKPTVIVSGGAQLRALVCRIARRAGLGVLAKMPALPAETTARELFPELPLFAPTAALRRTALLAIAAALEAPIVPRHYATSRRHSLSRPARASAARP
jgi:hypothetical protein